MFTILVCLLAADAPQAGVAEAETFQEVGDLAGLKWLHVAILWISSSPPPSRLGGGSQSGDPRFQFMVRFVPHRI